VTATIAPSTFSQVVNAYTDALLDELLAGADTCDCCGDPLWASVLNLATDTAWVDTDLPAIHDPHDRMRVAASLDRAPTSPGGEHLHGRFCVTCRDRAEAVSVAALLHILGAPANTITIGGDPS
jgi:hypothetical protein